MENSSKIQNTAEEKENLNILGLIKGSFQKYSMYFFLVIIMAAFQLLSDGVLLRPLNITNIILQNSYILILAIGMMILIILGEIDLSVGSITAFVGAFAAILTVKMNVPSPIAILLCLGVGAAIGAFQGFWVAYVKVPSFIATLAGMLIFRGLTIVILDGKSLGPFPKMIEGISSGFIPDVAQVEGIHLVTLGIAAVIAILFVVFSLRGRSKKVAHGFPVENTTLFLVKTVGIIAILGAFSYVMASYEGFPNVLIILAVLIMLYRFITSKTTVGRYIYATGGNEKAAGLSGIDTKKIKFLMFINMGVLAAIAGLIFSARLNAATATAGNGFELDAIAACYIGGASAFGGVGTILGAVIGGLVMGVLNNGMSLLGVGVDWQQAIKGIVLLLAVAFDIYNKNKAKA